MRQVAYRAWDPNRNRMYIIDAYAMDELGDIDYPIELEERHILMQYTGVKDMHNIKIYEGDIVRVHKTRTDGSDKALVEVNMLNPAEFVASYLVNEEGGNEYQFESMAIPNYFEVIGNIFENPELTKQP